MVEEVDVEGRGRWGEESKNTETRFEASRIRG